MPKQGKGPAATVDPRRQIAADRHLQQEITKALEGLADSLPAAVDLQLVHILGAILEPSWTEHVRFQDEALYPILVRRNAHAPEVLAMFERLRTEHTEISERHIEVTQHMAMLVEGRLANFEMFGYLLRSAFDCRNRHMIAEACIESWLPRSIAPADKALLDAWQANRSSPPFPASLLLGRVN